MKRSLSLVLVLALVIGMFSVFAISAGAEDTTAASAAPTEPTTPTEPTFPEGAVAIATAEEFAAMEAGKYYYLTADITVAATYETDFTGTFDGNGHTVTTSVALFKTLKGATVKNLTLNGEVTAAADDNRAAVLAKNASKVTIENVVNNANLNASCKGGYVGGFIAQGSTGGGTAKTHEKSYFTNCVNNGNITYVYEDAANQDTPRVAGIIGNVAKYQHGVYTNCVNNGKVSVTGAGLKGAPYVAGIAGSSFGGDFVNCVNNGDLYCTAGAHMGGILGRGTPSSQDTDQSSTATGCVNNGNLTIATDPAITSGSLGGIFGHCGVTMKKTANAVYTVEKCVNMGTLTCSGSQVGGMIGYVWGSDSATTWSYPVIKDCINLGKVVGTKKITFAEGEVPNPATFLATFASQFMGYVNATKTTIENCYGLGTVENTNDDYSVIFGLSSFKSLDYNNIKNVYLRANDGTKNYSWACDTADAVKDEAGNVTGYTITDDRTANRVSLEAYKALEDKAGNIVNDKDLFAVVEGTEASLIEAVVTAINANDNGFFFVDGGKVNSLEAAVAAVKDGGTIVLLNDVTLAAAATVEKSNMTFTIDGAGHTLTGSVTLKTPGCTVNVNNLKVVGNVVTDVNTAETMATLNANGLEIDATAKGTALTNNGFWNINLEGCRFVSKSAAFDNKLSGGCDNAKIVINKSYFEGKESYAIYLRQGCEAVITDSTLISSKNSGIQMITATEGKGTTLRLNNCNITSTTAYCVAVNPFNKVYINGGVYATTNKDACINVNGENAYCEIRSGSFTSNQNCAARAYGAGATLDIYDGEFYYTGTAGGSAIRGGTKDKGGTINIHGGVFSSAGTEYAVINGVHADSVITINAGKFINAGTAVIPVYTKTGSAGTDSIDFPEGQKEFVLGNPTPSDTTTENKPGDTTTENKPGDTTTENKPGDTTTENKPGDNTTTESKPTDSNKPGDTTTGATEEGGCNGCGGFAAAAQVVALLVGVVGVALVVKRK